MQKLLWKEWTVNATDVEWVECEHMNKTGLKVQLETQIHDVTSQLDLATRKNQPHKHLQSNLEQLRNKLSTKMSNWKFKLELEQCSPKISVKRYNTSSKKVEFCCKMRMSKDAIVVTLWPTGGLPAKLKTGNMLSCLVYAHYQDYTLLSQLTWTNHSNHLQNSKIHWKCKTKRNQ